MTEKYAEKTLTPLPVPSLLLCYWSSQLFELHVPSSIDILILLLNQPNVLVVMVII